MTALGEVLAMGLGGGEDKDKLVEKLKLERNLSNWLWTDEV